MIAKSRFVHNPKTKGMFERELSILQSLRHHNITRLIDYYEDESTLCKCFFILLGSFALILCSSTVIVMEIVPGGDLLQYIVDHGAVPEDDARVFTAQMVDAIMVRLDWPSMVKLELTICFLSMFIGRASHTVT